MNRLIVVGMWIREKDNPRDRIEIHLGVHRQLKRIQKLSRLRKVIIYYKTRR